tara:strand:- start:848 stop:1264 length:417 start_codon:yes stop_codon:yes gene_type:complete
MSFNLEDLTEEELHFYNYKGEVSKEEILKHLNSGLSFSDAVVTEAQESLVSYYNWVKNNVKDEDKSKVTDWDIRHETNYTGDNLTEYEKKLFETLPNVGKWQVGNYSRMWRGLEEANDCLVEFIHHELDYLCNPSLNG